MRTRGMRLKLKLFGLMLLASAAAPAPAGAQAKEGCLDRCGDVSIPYPFGTSEQCFLSSYFQVTCDMSSNSPKLLLGAEASRGGHLQHLQVRNISVEGELLILNHISRDCYDSSGKKDEPNSYVSDLWPGQFNISTTRNKFTMVGCDTFAWMEGQRGEHHYRTGCMSQCHSLTDIETGSCSGTCCCQTSIPDDLSAINLTLGSYRKYSGVWKFNPCGYAFIVEESYFTFSPNDLRDLKSKDTLPMVFDWAFGEKTCQVHENNRTIYACKGNSSCQKRTTGWGYLCNCSEGYHGNPYLESGCQDINECEDPVLNMCENPKSCINTPGNHTCTCPMWHYGDGRKDSEGCIHNHKLIIETVMGIGTALVVFPVACIWLCWVLKRRRFLKLKKKYFKQNGGSELRLQLSKQGCTGRIKFFSSEELEKATHKYDESDIIGRGGSGTVYRGTLKDGRVVAIKKPKMVEPSRGKDFTNEVAILSQINHRHVIRLLGCCLEIQVPLLVYEFITNGTLSDHIHDENKASAISWETRLKIAIQTAEALYYLHSVASTPIVHRDVKSSNILLDEDYNAKVSDFGASRLVPSGETQLSTAVQGTPGYLDPESFQTNRVTEKSDVYSFGVVLVELITGKRALFFYRPKEQKILTMFFLFALKDNNLFQVLDDCIANRGNQMQILKVAEIAKRCLSLKGEDRPTMREVVLELELVRKIEKNDEEYREDDTYLLEKSAAQCYVGGSELLSTGTNSMVDGFLSQTFDAR